MDRVLRLATCLGLLCLAAPASASAAPDPVMPLAQVQAGMRCTALSVIRGTEPASFDVEVLDVVRGEASADGPLILISVSGPAVDRTGIGPGFSGSPIYCPDAAGVPRNAGAIAYGVGEYGNRVALATPIEQILGEEVDPPKGAVRASRAVRASARPLVSPLTVSGLTPTLARRLELAAGRSGRTVLAGPSTPAPPFPPQTLRPGSAMAVGMSSGDLAMGAVGTVSYTDGDRVWAFGHPLEGAGPRSLMLQDAYVYGVINNPLGVGEVSSYKLAVPGHDLGTLTNDALAAVVGRIGALPRRIPVRVVARDLDTGRVRETLTRVADEGAAGVDAESPAFTLVGALSLLQAETLALRSQAPHLSTMCLAITVRELPRALRFCNRYGATGGAAGDFAGASALIDSYQAGRLHVTGAEARLDLRRGRREAFLSSARAPGRVRPGQLVPLTLTLQRPRGPRERVTARVRVPRRARAGPLKLTLSGASASSGDEGTEVIELLLEGEGSSGSGPRTLQDLVKKVGAIQRYDGVRARVGQGTRQRAYRDPALLITGRTRVTLRVAGAPTRRGVKPAK